jgi:hypothetical protein
MNRTAVGRILAFILAIVVLGAVGVLAYNAGVAEGLAASGEAVGEGRFDRPYIGWGFGPFAILFWILIFFLFFGLLRALLWGGPRHYGAPGGWHEGWGRDLPPRFEDWHRRAHGDEPPAPPTERGSSTA